MLRLQLIEDIPHLLVVAAKSQSDTWSSVNLSPIDVVTLVFGGVACIRALVRFGWWLGRRKQQRASTFLGGSLGAPLLAGSDPSEDPEGRQSESGPDIEPEPEPQPEPEPEQPNVSRPASPDRERQDQGAVPGGSE